MTKNEYIASIMLEAAELLKEDAGSLNEAIFEKQKSSNKNIRKEVDAGLSGKYDDKFIRSEKELVDFLDKYGDQISEIAKATKEDINNSRKFTKGKIATIAILIIGILTSAITGGLACKLSIQKMDADFAKKVKEMRDKYEEGVKEMHDRYEEGVKKMRTRSGLVDSMLNDSIACDSVSDNLYDYNSLNESALGIASIVSALATVLFSIVEGLLRYKDARDIHENIKYLKMIKRKLTKDITKIKNPQVRDKYEILIERINRAEDEYTRKVVSTNE